MNDAYGLILNEFTRMGLIYVHLIACCVAIGLVLTSDLAMIRQLMSGDPRARIDAPHLSELQRTVSAALIALWLSGLAIVWVDIAMKGTGYLANPKLQAKIGIVVLLTLNGLALHRRVLPWLQKAGSLLYMPFRRTMWALFCGAVSGVSWFYAAMLGVGRPLSWNFSLIELMAAYPLLIAGGFFGMLTLVFWSQSRAIDALPGGMRALRPQDHPLQLA